MPAITDKGDLKMSKARRKLRRDMRGCPDCYRSKMRGVASLESDGSVLCSSGQVVCAKHAAGRQHLAELTFRHETLK